MSYALNLVGNPSYLSAPNRTVYNFSTGDFTLQRWIKTRASGTVISRKAAEGGSGNGGFLLEVKHSGIIKLAMDIRDQDLKTLRDLKLPVFPVRVV